MQCEIFNIEKINSYMDGELEQKDNESIEEHLVECEYCRNYFMELKGAISLLKDGVEIEEAPPALWNSIQKRLSKCRRQAIIFKLSVVPIAATAVLLLIFGLSGRKPGNNELKNFFQTQLAYMEGENLIEDQYYNNDIEDSYVTMYLNGDI